jgi:hypothetical protein
MCLQRRTIHRVCADVPEDHSAREQAKAQKGAATLDLLDDLEGRQNHHQVEVGPGEAARQ